MISIPFDSCERVRADGARLPEADAVLPSIGSRFLRVPRKVELHASSLLRSRQRLGSASQGHHPPPGFWAVGCMPSLRHGLDEVLQLEYLQHHLRTLGQT